MVATDCEHSLVLYGVATSWTKEERGFESRNDWRFFVPKSRLTGQLSSAGLVPESASKVAQGGAPEGRAEEEGGAGEGRRHREAGLQGNDGGVRRRDRQGMATDCVQTDLFFGQI